MDSEEKPSNDQLDDFISDELYRWNWLVDKVFQSIDKWFDVWLIEDPPELNVLNPNYMKKLVYNSLKSEMQYLVEDPVYYLEMNGDDLLGSEWKNMINDYRPRKDDPGGETDQDNTDVDIPI